MDDLLIVRRSDRSRERFSRRTRHTPLGANLGLVLGTAFAFLYLANRQDVSFFAWAGSGPQLSSYSLAFGIAGGLALGGILGLALRSRFRPPRSPRASGRYEGFPISSESESEEKPAS